MDHAAFQILGGLLFAFVGCTITLILVFLRERKSQVEKRAQVAVTHLKQIQRRNKKPRRKKHK